MVDVDSSGAAPVEISVILELIELLEKKFFVGVPKVFFIEL